MKTIADVDNEIDSITEFIKSHKEELTDGKINKEKKKIEFLRWIRKYLELSPSIEFCQSEQMRIAELIQKKEAQYDQWKHNLAPKDVDCKNWPTIFRKEVGIILMKQQLKTINYILNS